MRKLLLVTIFILFSSTAQAIPYQYSNTIDMSGYAIEGLSSNGSNLLAILGDWPVDKIGTFDVSGNLINSFDAIGAFTAGLAYNGSRIIFSGGQDYDGNLYEMNPLNGAISDPLGFSGYVQPHLAFDGSNILASGGATGTNGVLTVPINKLDSATYNSVGTISVTVDTGAANVSGVSRSMIEWHNNSLFVALAIGGTNTIYQFDSNLNLIEEIVISEIMSGSAIRGFTFVANDLYVLNSGTNEIYRYIESTAVPTIPIDKDSFMRGRLKNLNEGANTSLVVQKRGRKRTVLSFDISGISTPPATATLILTVAEDAKNWGQDGRFVDVCRLNEPFTEGNGFVWGRKRADKDRGTGEGVTWRCASDADISNRRRDCDFSWRGGSMSMAVVATDSILHTNDLVVGDTVQWDVTNDVIAAIGEGKTEIRWVVKKEIERQRGKIVYYSKEGAAVEDNTDLAPKLVLE